MKIKMTQHQPKKIPIREQTIALAMSSIIGLSILGNPSPISANTNKPTLNLFPVSVVEHLKSSAESAKLMENGMEDVIAKMESQMQLYRDAQCGQEDIDPGCAGIKKSVNETYQDMLGQMQRQLPTMRKAMKSTSSTLGKKIAAELGRKMTPLDLQRLIEGKSKNAKRVRTVTGRRQGRMSAMLGKYHQMIALGKTQGQNTAILAAEIYTDATETLDTLDLIESEISRSLTLGGIDTIWNGEPSPEMMATVKSVKTLLFGELETSTIPAPVQPGGETEIDDFSDLTLD
ncbi:MAG: hypothetical protein V3V31_13105 [Methylococcales bacterium]